MGLARAIARLVCLGLLMQALAGCGVYGAMMQDINDLRGSSKPDDPRLGGNVPEVRLHDFLDQSATPVPGENIEPGGFFSNNGTLLDEAFLGDLAAANTYVLVGEGHTVACDHMAQADVLRAMAKAGRPPVVGLEMVAVDNRSGLHGFNLGHYGVDTLRKALHWDETWGHPFELYLPIFETARELGLPLEALNVPRDVIRAIGEKGLDGLAPEQKAMLPALVVPPMDSQSAYLEEEFKRHMGMLPDNATSDDGQALERFLQVQSAWDTKMAEEAIHAWRRTGRPVAVMAGAGHVEYGWGIAMRLRRLDKAARVLTVMPWRGGLVDRSQADVFFYCPMSHSSRLGFTLEKADGGARVTSVQSGSRAEAAGLAKDDLIVKAQGQAVSELFDLHRAAVLAAKADQDLELTVRRPGAGGDEDMVVRIPLKRGGPDGGSPRP